MSNPIVDALVPHLPGVSRPIVEALVKFIPGIVRTIQAGQADRLERAVDEATIKVAKAFDDRRAEEERKRREREGEGQE